MKISAIFYLSATLLASVPSGAQVDRILSPQVQRCSQNIYERIAAHESKTDQACSLGRTDTAFQACVISLTHELDRKNQPQGFPDSNNVTIASEACAYTANREMAQCTVDLYLYGGLYVVDRTGLDGLKVCQSSQSTQLKACVMNTYQAGRHTGKQALKACLDQIDPVARAAKAERDRLEEQRRAEEQRVLAQRQAAEQERIRIENQNRFEDEIQRLAVTGVTRVDGSAESRIAPAPAAPSDSGRSTGTQQGPSASDDGIILDLPNFE